MSLVLSPGLVNSQNAHFSNPGFSSKVGAVTGCGGSGSELALQQKGLYQVVKTGGKRMRRTRKGSRGKGSRGKGSRGKGSKRKSHKMKGGVGHEFSQQQTLVERSGVGAGHSVHRGEHSTYEHTGINSDTNMNASKQAGQAGGSSFGTGGYPYYSYKPSDGENLSLFAGSGCPPISRGLNSQCGGKRRGRKGKSKKGGRKGKSKKGGRKRTKRRSSSKRQRGGYSQYMSNVANAHNYSTGAPPALTAGSSALANPPPYTPSNDCLNTWKHLGDTPPYNQVYN
jgi:hypothetical protein